MLFWICFMTESLCYFFENLEILDFLNFLLITKLEPGPSLGGVQRRSNLFE